MESQLHGRNLIAGQTTGGGEVFYAVNPADCQDLEPCAYEATDEEIDAALRVAEQAFGEFRHKPASQRAALLEAIAEEIDGTGDALIERADCETALGPDRLKAERGRTVGQLRMFASLIREGSWVDARIDHADAGRKPVPKPDVRRMKIAIGPIVVFAASNFPLALSVAGGDTASALAAGCPVVVKTHPTQPGTSEIVAQAILRAIKKTHMPEGVFAMLHGRGPVVGLGLVRHPLTRAVGFTGSLRAGRALFDAAAARPEPIPVYAEMGSINPLFVLPGALVARGQEIAQGLRQSVTLGVGQFCTCPGLVVGIESDATRAFTSHLASLFEEARPATMLHAMIRDTYTESVERLSDTPGVSVLAKSRTSADSSRTQAAPVVLATDANTFMMNRELGEELFGPATIVVTAKSKAELEQLAQSLEGHLTATIHGTPQELPEWRNLVHILERKVGRLLFNGYPTGVEVCHAMQHGGPYPAATDPHFTSIGSAAIERWVRPIAYQNFPDAVLPAELQNENPRKIWRLVDSHWTRDASKGA